ncbi:ribonuclease III [Myxococcota bacterium]|nr:ribonuclease III [Myxococcota bacterium]MBU1413022.1 ribonuclease III [Myxococcota bacterium]MBU1511700.1 ribonuclease III [Myxococcota bacterium]
MSELFADLEAKIRHHFAEPALLEQAMTHKSFCGDPGKETSIHNEKLEFLGDAVIDLAIASLLMQYLPEATEGVLTRRRASLVNQGTLASKALGLGLDNFLRVGKSEECSEGRTKPSLLSDAFEALIGALYLDAGLDFVLELAEDIFFEELCVGSDRDQTSAEALGDFKSALQELTQSAYRQLPVYTLLEQRGPEHLQVFAYEVRVGEVVCAVGEGNSKKRAQQEAARAALELLRQPADGENGETT